MNDPYAKGSIRQSLYGARRPIRGAVVAVLRGRLEERGLELIQPISRALARGEIHELIVTDEAGAAPGTRVDRIGYLCFFEVEQGGVAVTGDQVMLGGEGGLVLAGFDLTHAPNHLNVVVCGDRRPGEERGIRPGDQVTIGPQAG